jgi:hypothetical protein
VIDVIIAIISITFGTMGLIDVWNHRKSIAKQRDSISIGLGLDDFPEFQSETKENSNSTYSLSSDVQNEINIADQNTQLIIAMVVIVVLFVHIAFYITNLVLGIFLFYSAFRKSREKCHLWFILTLIIWVITLISFMINLISLKGSESSNSNAELGKSHSYFSTVTSVFNLLYKAYALWLVRCYVNLLRFNNARFVADYNASTGDVNQEDQECSAGLTRIPS